MTDWRSLYEAALTETNALSLERLVYQTEDAITRRLLELARTNRDFPEVKELQAAANEILRVKVQRLGWSDPLALAGHAAPLSAPRASPSQDFEIFSGRPEAEPLWLETVQGLAAAHQRMRLLAAKSPGPYFIFSTRTSEVIALLDATTGNNSSQPRHTRD